MCLKLPPKRREQNQQRRMTEILKAEFCQWKSGGEKQCNGRHQTAKGNIWRVMFTSVFFSTEMCAAVSEACREWCLSEINTTERQPRDAGRQRSFKWGRIKTPQNHKIWVWFKKASSQPLPHYMACHFNYACLYQSELIKSFKTNKATSAVRQQQMQ